MLNQWKEKRKVRTLNNRRQISPNEQNGRMVAVKGAAAVDSVAVAGWAELRLPIYTLYLLVTLYGN